MSTPRKIHDYPYPLRSSLPLLELLRRDPVMTGHNIANEVGRLDEILNSIEIELKSVEEYGFDSFSTPGFSGRDAKMTISGFMADFDHVGMKLFSTGTGAKESTPSTNMSYPTPTYGLRATRQNTDHYAGITDRCVKDERDKADQALKEAATKAAKQAERIKSLEQDLATIKRLNDGDDDAIEQIVNRALAATS